MGLANSIRRLDENAGKGFLRRLNVNKSLSSCRLNKQSLINLLEARVNERPCAADDPWQGYRQKFRVFFREA
jgi:hypothetical protein